MQASHYIGGCPVRKKGTSNSDCKGPSVRVCVCTSECAHMRVYMHAMGTVARLISGERGWVTEQADRCAYN